MSLADPILLCREHDPGGMMSLFALQAAPWLKANQTPRSERKDALVAGFVLGFSYNKHDDHTAILI